MKATRTTFGIILIAVMTLILLTPLAQASEDIHFSGTCRDGQTRHTFRVPSDTSRIIVNYSFVTDFDDPNIDLTIKDAKGYVSESVRLKRSPGSFTITSIQNPGTFTLEVSPNQCSSDKETSWEVDIAIVGGGASIGSNVAGETETPMALMGVSTVVLVLIVLYFYRTDPPTLVQ